MIFTISSTGSTASADLQSSHADDVELTAITESVGFIAGVAGGAVALLLLVLLIVGACVWSARRKASSTPQEMPSDVIELAQPVIISAASSQEYGLLPTSPAPLAGHYDIGNLEQ